jgi:adenylosuccinate lyase
MRNIGVAFSYSL